MKQGRSRPRARQYLDSLVMSSRYTFTTTDAQRALGLSAPALKVTLHRLARQKLIASPARGFHIIVPPEYRSLGSLPAEQFVPDLMKRLGLPYYVGVLSASQYHGAAHQRPQVFQVLLEKARRPIECGLVKVVFIVRKNLRHVPTQKRNTPRGTILISTPEATAFDLVGYPRHAAGFNNVATVLTELAERIEGKALVQVAEVSPVPWAQRLGYLLERVGAGAKTDALKAWVRRHAHESVLLQTNAPRARAARDGTWKLFVNADIEADL